MIKHEWYLVVKKSLLEEEKKNIVPFSLPQLDITKKILVVRVSVIISYSEPLNGINCNLAQGKTGDSRGD